MCERWQPTQFCPSSAMVLKIGRTFASKKAMSSRSLPASMPLDRPREARSERAISFWRGFVRPRERLRSPSSIAALFTIAGAAWIACSAFSRTPPFSSTSAPLDHADEPQVVGRLLFSAAIDVNSAMRWAGEGRSRADRNAFSDAIPGLARTTRIAATLGSASASSSRASRTAERTAASSSRFGNADRARIDAARASGSVVLEVVDERLAAIERRVFNGTEPADERQRRGRGPQAAGWRGGRRRARSIAASALPGLTSSGNSLLIVAAHSRTSASGSPRRSATARASAGRDRRGA